jgi:hypothetical protein
MKITLFKFDSRKTIRENSIALGVSQKTVKNFMFKHKIDGQENNFKRRIREIIQCKRELQKQGIKPTNKLLSQKLNWGKNTVTKYNRLIPKEGNNFLPNLGIRPSFILKSYSFDQNEILYNIMQLHNCGKGFHLDVTYGLGKFYEQSKKYYIPQPRIKMDVQPQMDQMEDIIQIEPLSKFPLEDNTISSIVLDLPFIIAGKLSDNSINKNSNMIQRRFSSYQDRNSLFQSYYHFISEAYRVLQPNGICVIKTQATVSCSTQIFTPEYVWLIAQKLGFYVLDQAFLISKNRLHSSKIQHQQHFRKHISNFYVLKKTKKKVDYFKWQEKG